MRVLLPIDTDEDRGRLAAEAVLSLPNAAEEVQVTILNVQKKLDLTDDGAHVNSEEWYDADNFPVSAEQAAEILETAGVSVEIRREHGNPTQEILNTSREIDAERIIMCGRKRTSVGKVLFGSVTQSVLLNSEIPVTVIAH